MLGLLAMVFYLGGFVCWIIVLISAFQDEVWKGVVGLLCGLYLLYYGIVEFEHPNKWAIVGGGIACNVIGGVLGFMNAAAHAR